MSNDMINVSFTCPNCGETELKIPDNYDDDSNAKCKKCGNDFGPLGKIKEKAVGLAKESMEQKFRDIFKDRKGWTLK